MSQETISRELIRQCVQCGMCLSACPTFRLTGSELDSPRGRIFQMDLVRRGQVSPDDADFIQHMDFCLGCRACEPVCPSGVRYGRLIEQARAVIPQRRLPLTVRMMHRAVAGRLSLRLFGLAIRLYQKLGLQWLVRSTRLVRLLPSSLRQADETLPRLEGGLLPRRLPSTNAAEGAQRRCVGMLAGCVMAEFLPDTNRATVDVLTANGCEVIVPAGQRCCGALHIHGGDTATARALAVRNIRAFEAVDADAVVTNSAGCGSALKEYGELLAGDDEWRDRAQCFAGKVRDVQEFVAEIGIVPPPGRMNLRVTYQDACHLVHGQRVREQPRELLRAIPGLELVEMPNSDWCCGSAGTYNLEQPQASAQLLDQKLDAIESTGAQVVAAANPGCLMQLEAGLRRRRADIRVAHPMALVAEAYRSSRAEKRD
jgi:glycolate dehydrogenase iron-sulfur subunit